MNPSILLIFYPENKHPRIIYCIHYLDFSSIGLSGSDLVLYLFAKTAKHLCYIQLLSEHNPAPYFFPRSLVRKLLHQEFDPKRYGAKILWTHNVFVINFEAVTLFSCNNIFSSAIFLHASLFAEEFIQ